MLRDLPPLGPRVSNDSTTLMNGALSDQDTNISLHESRDAPLGPLDDVFGSAPSSPTLHAHDHQNRMSRNPNDEHFDVPRLRSVHVTNGYREGIAVSKEQYIQAGFDEGYSLGGEIGSRAGYLLGVLEGIAKASRKASNEDEGRERLGTMVNGTWEEAIEELKMEKLFSQEYFGPDGVWTYGVPGQDEREEEESMTFGDVARWHPVLRKWHGRIQELVKKVGFGLKLEFVD